MKPRNERDTVYRSCNLCEAHCGISVSVDRAEGRVVDIRGDENDPLSQGYVCPKVVGLRTLSEDPDRLRAPVKRSGNRFVEIGWDEALELAASRIREIRETHGANAIATYLGNPNDHDFASTLSIAPLVRSLGTRWRVRPPVSTSCPRWCRAVCCLGGPPLSRFPTWTVPTSCSRSAQIPSRRMGA